jgi:hypothetical protein
MEQPRRERAGCELDTEETLISRCARAKGHLRELQESVENVGVTEAVRANDRFFSGFST